MTSRTTWHSAQSFGAKRLPTMTSFATPIQLLQPIIPIFLFIGFVINWKKFVLSSMDFIFTLIFALEIGGSHWRPFAPLSDCFPPLELY